MRHYFTVWVDCDTQEQAEIVMSERTSYDEFYGFDYTIDWSDTSVPTGSDGYSVGDALTAITSDLSNLPAGTQLVIESIGKALNMAEGTDILFRCKDTKTGKRVDLHAYWVVKGTFKHTPCSSVDIDSTREGLVDLRKRLGTDV